MGGEIDTIGNIEFSKEQKKQLAEHLNKYRNFEEYWIHLLEQHPMLFYMHLSYYSEHDFELAEKIVNSYCYGSWFGNIAHCIVYLTGIPKVIDAEEIKGESTPSFYGCNINKIDDVFGMKLLNLAIRCNVDLNFKDYYDRTPGDIPSDTVLAVRTNNDKLLKLLKLYY